MPPDLDATTKQIIMECIIAVIGAGVHEDIISAPASFLSAGEESIRKCLIDKGVKLGEKELRLGLRTEVGSCGEWIDLGPARP